MTDAAGNTVNLSTLTDLVEAVPTLLGFHPSESVVVAAIVSGHVVVTARVDLPPPGGPSPARALAAVWRRFPQACLIVVAFSASSVRAWEALDEVDRAIPEGMGRVFAHADELRWYDAPEGDGVPYDALGSVHLARAAYAGRLVRGSREEIAALIEPVRTPAEVTASLDRVGSREGGLGELVADAVALVDAFDDAPGEVDLDDATLLCLASHDEAFLDSAILSTTRENAAARVQLWLAVVRSSVPNCAGGALAALGVAAWVADEGALQVVCTEALSQREAPEAWLVFLEGLNLEAVEPGRWPEIRAAFLADRRRADAEAC